MEYKDFLTELAEIEEWDGENKCEIVYRDGSPTIECRPTTDLDIPHNPDVINVAEEVDMVNSPSHYTQGTQEAIDIIEEAIANAPGPVTGMLQAQTLKYLLRLWNKENSVQDAKKAAWYLNRLIAKLEG